MIAANNAIAQPSMSCQIEFHLIQIIEVVALHHKENITRPGRASQQYGPHVIGACPRDVRFTPESRHYGARLECPLCANSGHQLQSITSSARASMVGGISKPSTFAVFMLMTKSNLVGCTTGRSAGFSPFRIRPV